MRLDAALAQHKIHIITLPSGYSSSSYDREKGSRIISSRAAAAAAARRTSWRAAAAAARLAKASQLDGAYPTTTY